MPQGSHLSLLLSHLESLQSAGLVNVAQVHPELEYFFRHILVQDAAYQSLLRSDRKALHLAVGEILESSHPGRPEELAARLGDHFFEAGDRPRALKYLTEAGDDASRRYANAEAAMHYARALSLARQTEVEREKIIHLYSRYGMILELNGEYQAALENYLEMEALSRARSDPSIELEALMSRAKVHATPNPAHDSRLAQELLEQALRIARELQDRRAQSQILWNLMILHVYGGGDYRQAIEYGREALAAARALNLVDRIAFTLNDLTYAYIATDQWEQALASQQEACRLWRESGNLTMLADNLANSVLIHFHSGDFDRALNAAEEAMQISRSTGNLWGQAGSRVYAGWIYMERGEPDQAINIMEAALRLGEESSHPAALIGTRTDLGWVYGSLGMVVEGLSLAQEAYKQASHSSLAHLGVWPLSVIARLHLLDGNLEAAEKTIHTGYSQLQQDGLQWFSKVFLPLAKGELALAREAYGEALQAADGLVAYLNQTGMRPFAADALWLIGKALIGMHQIEAAREKLFQARERAESIGSRRSLWPVLATLGEIETQQGNIASADALYREANEILDYIAAYIRKKELQDAFLDLPYVRSIRSKG